MAATPSVAFGPIGNRGALPQLPVTDCTTHGLLVASTVKTIAVPSGSKFAAVVFGSDAYATLDGSAPVVPSGDLTGSVVIPIPAGSGRVLPLDSSTGNLKLISASAGIFSVEFFI